MIICTKCGHKNGNDESFCQNPACGAFLEWEGKAAQTGVMPPVGGASPPGAKDRSDVADVTPGRAIQSGAPPAGAMGKPPSGGAGRPASGGSPTRQAGRRGGPPSRPATPPPGGGRAADPGEATGFFDAAAEAARPDDAPGPARPEPVRRTEQAKQMLVRPGDRPAGKRPQGQPEAQRPREAQQPQLPVDQGPRGPVIEPGQIACATCGWGNDPGRHFCRHCGASLTVPPAPTEVRPAKTGTIRRPPVDSERGLRLLLAALGGLAIVTAAVLLGLSLFRGGDNGGGGGTVTTVGRGGGGGVAEVPPSAIRVAASTQSGERVAANLIDGDLGTFWSRRVNDQFAAITFKFTQPVKLARISIAAGAAGDEFRRRHRPKQIRLEFSDGATQTANLADQPDFQNVEVKPRTVDRLRIVILDVYQAPSGQNRRLTSISEVRFFGAG
ncbi:MAG TPA: discoidin domain-containing protein [Actinomycetota bacterium]|nr:discoidin domain-containing protein [Actinomycetota bacterium]